MGIAVDDEEPIEPAEDGCPAGWSRSPFADSVAKYARRRIDGGGRVERPAFNASSWQVQEAVEYLEEQEERWHAYRAEVDHGRWESKQKG